MRTAITGMIFLVGLSSAQAQFQEVGSDESTPPAATSSDAENPAKKLPVPKIVDDEGDKDPVLDNPSAISFSATVNVIRKVGRTEVMFRNGESYFIPSGSKFNEIYAACEESERTGKEVSIIANSRTRTIIQAGSAGKGVKGREK